MHLARPKLVPTADLDREAMDRVQRTVAEAVIAADDGVPEAIDDDVTVAGVDQAFTEQAVVSAAVALRVGESVDRAVVHRPIVLPYVPGYLAFREAAAVVDAVTALSDPPAVLFVDGNGLLHPRAAGLATHVGVILDRPTVGVAKSLLCGALDGPEPPYDVGTRVPIVATEEMTLPTGSIVGYAVQTRQWDAPDRHINPVYVSPGHRISPETAADHVLATVAGRKLPEPIRLADRAADAAAHGRSDR